MHVDAELRQVRRAREELLPARKELLHRARLGEVAERRAVGRGQPAERRAGRCGLLDESRRHRGRTSGGEHVRHGVLLAAAGLVRFLEQPGEQLPGVVVGRVASRGFL